MNAREDYKEIGEDVFGKHTTSFDTNLNVSNNIIGALNHPDEFQNFINA